MNWIDSFVATSFDSINIFGPVTRDPPFKILKIPTGWSPDVTVRGALPVTRCACCWFTRIICSLLHLDKEISQSFKNLFVLIRSISDG